MILRVIQCDHCGAVRSTDMPHVCVYRMPGCREHWFCSMRCLEQWIKAPAGENERAADDSGVGDA